MLRLAVNVLKLREKSYKSRERERKRQRETERDIERQRETEKDRERERQSRETKRDQNFTFGVDAGIIQNFLLFLLFLSHLFPQKFKYLIILVQYLTPTPTWR